VEGIGTFDKLPDDFGGLGFGTGLGGVKEKAGKGLDKILYKVTRQNIRKKKIKCFDLDTFGFSRGAAATRYFIYIALKKNGSKLEDKLKDRGYSIEQKPEVKFVGLFDTVATYGIFTENHGIIKGDDVSQLKLDSIKEAEYTLQLAAADEHREKFRLTNINSVNQSKGCELFLPGVHSDVGGGYNDYENEIQLILMRFENYTNYLSKHQVEVLLNERQRLIKEGWYKENEVKIFYNNKYSAMSNCGYIVVNKSNIRNTYSRIPLHIMANFAQNRGEVNLYDLALSKNKIESSDLKNAKEEIEQYIPKPGAQDIHNVNEKLKIETLKILRHDYFHFSAHYESIAKHPQFSDGGPEYGKRERKIQDG
jgi:hypothetical protein